jgi:hypothetical protein
MDAKIIKTNMEMVEIKPANGKKFTSYELKEIVGGRLDIIKLYDEGKLLIVNDDAGKYSLPFNEEATYRYRCEYSDHEWAVNGDAILVDSNLIE